MSITVQYYMDIAILQYSIAVQYYMGITVHYYTIVSDCSSTVQYYISITVQYYMAITVQYYIIITSALQHSIKWVLQYKVQLRHFHHNRYRNLCHHSPTSSYHTHPHNYTTALQHHQSIIIIIIIVISCPWITLPIDQPQKIRVGHNPFISDGDKSLSSLLIIISMH